MQTSICSKSSRSISSSLVRRSSAEDEDVEEGAELNDAQTEKTGKWPIYAPVSVETSIKYLDSKGE